MPLPAMPQWLAISEWSPISHSALIRVNSEMRTLSPNVILSGCRMTTKSAMVVFFPIFIILGFYHIATRRKFNSHNEK